MAITIVRSGIAERVPDEARCCPVCGYGPQNYRLKEEYVDPRMQMCCIGKMPMLVPTFTCEHCGCIWQWEPDKETMETE